MHRYQVTFTMQTGCRIPPEEIRHQIQVLLGKVGMSVRTIASVAVSEVGETPKPNLDAEREA